MSTSFKSVEQILAEIPDLQTYLLDSKSYWAHCKEGEEKAPELLSEHIALVNQYFLNLVKSHQLDRVIDSLIQTYLLDTYQTNKAIGEEIKVQLVTSIGFHDHGKINVNFQAALDKMANPAFQSRKQVRSPISTTHSALGAYIYLVKRVNHIVNYFKAEDQLAVLATAYLFSYVIFKHHSSYLDDELSKTVNFDAVFTSGAKQELLETMKAYLSQFNFDFDTRILDLLGNEQVLAICLDQSSKSTAMFGLLRLTYSLLTASDYLATNEYSSAHAVHDFGLFSPERIAKIYSQLSQDKYFVNQPSKQNFNAQTFAELDSYQLTNPREAKGENLNVLRKEMGIELLRNLRKHADSNLFYIEAPTGGGKTNLSALAAFELLKQAKGKLNKVFYVFPFLTLITQTLRSLKDTIGLQPDEIIELHSKAAFAEKEGNEGRYGKDKLNYIDNLFVHYPLTLLSHISFFDILKSNRKEQIYLLHRLANSVVVMDELQSYNPKHWDKIISFIRYYAEHFHIKFILMSATLPKLEKLNNLKDEVSDFVYLLPEAREKYFLNPNFSQRISFDFSFFERIDLSLEELAEKLLEESKNYASFDFGSAKPQGSVYTIIEFIYKQSATDFYKLVSQSSFFDEVFVLSGTILEHRRQYIIRYLKNKANRTKKILLITTQVVEAGVDIDMDLGFKDRSLIDSDEQLAGRINRNVNKKNCKLFLFNFNKEEAVYGDDVRLQMTRKHISPQLYKEILETKNFDGLYDLVINNRNSWNNTPFAENILPYTEHIKSLRFQQVADNFKLINAQNISCFIPLNIPIKVGNQAFFSPKELDFLAEFAIYPTAEQKIAGSAVFDLYLGIIHNRTDFVAQKIREKILQSILAKYVISLFASPKLEEQLIHFSDLEKSAYGYYYLSRWADFYTEEVGVDTTKLYGIEESQFL